MASIKSETKFGNKLSEINFVRHVLLEFGVSGEKDTEIDRIITLAKVEVSQDKMMKELEKKAKVPVEGNMDKYVIKSK